QDPGFLRAEVWGLPWISDVPNGFPGLAYCIGGRSVFFGGWAPQLLDEEMPLAPDASHPNAWPQTVVDDLKNPLSADRPGYFRQAAEQIGVTQTNDFIFGTLHAAIRQQLFTAVENAAIRGAIPLAELPQVLDGVPPGEEDIFKL